MSSRAKIIIAIVAIIVLALIGYFIYKAYSGSGSGAIVTTQQGGGGTTTQTGGLLSWLAGVLPDNFGQNLSIT